MKAHWYAALLAWWIFFSGSAAWAQSPQDFVGDWSVEGGPLGSCSLNLSGQAMGGQLKATTYTCAGQMSFAWAWAASGPNVTILGHNNYRIAALTLDRGVLVGRMNDGSLVTMRPASGQRFGRRPDDSRRRDDSRWSDNRRDDCYLREDTGRCADVDDIPPPRGKRHIRAVNLLNVRQALDMSSPVISQLQPNQCYVINGCQDTRWGPRCEIRFADGTIGYTVKYYERDRRNYIGFLNRC